MKALGNIERFLVIGIVVVIGAILAVAIRGANEARGEYEKELASKSGPQGGSKDANAKTAKGPKAGIGSVGNDSARNDPTQLKRDIRTNKPVAGAGGGSLPSAPVAPLAPAVKKALLDQREAALNGVNPGPAPAGPIGPAGVAGGGAPVDSPAKHDVSDAPIVEDEKLANGGKLSPPGPVLPGGPSNAPNPGAPPAGNGGTTNPKPVDGVKPAPIAPLAKSYTYEMQKSDTLERVARALYDEPGQWRAILAMNPELNDGHSVRAGAKIKLPKEPKNASPFVTAVAVAAVSEPVAGPNQPNVKKPLDPKLALSKSETKSELPKIEPKVDPKVEPAKVAATFKRTTASEKYKIQGGDTLMSIADANYGTKKAWKVIFDANADVLHDKDHIKVGLVLKLPAQ